MIKELYEILVELDDRTQMLCRDSGYLVTPLVEQFRKILQEIAPDECECSKSCVRCVRRSEEVVAGNICWTCFPNPERPNFERAK